MPVFSDVNLNIFVSFSEANQHFVGRRENILFLRPSTETVHWLLKRTQKYSAQQSNPWKYIKILWVPVLGNLMENAMQMFDFSFQSLKAYKYTCFDRLQRWMQVIPETVLVIAVTLAKISWKDIYQWFFLWAGSSPYVHSRHETLKGGFKAI